MTKDRSGLCYRCEYRAQYLEVGHAPRCECGSIKNANYSCYMYKPVKPVIIAKNEKDNRPQFAGSMFSARSHLIEREPDLKLHLKEYEDGSMIYWKPAPKRRRKNAGKS